MTSYLSKNTGKEVIHNLKEQAKRQIDFEDAVEEQEEEVLIEIGTQEEKAVEKETRKELVAAKNARIVTRNHLHKQLGEHKQLEWWWWMILEGNIMWQEGELIWEHLKQSWRHTMEKKL